MLKENSYILQLEAKDIILSDYKYKVKKNKKYKATLDYSLECIQLEKVARSIYKGKKDTNIFYLENGKQKTNSVVSVNFDYSVKEYNKNTLSKKTIYTLYNNDIQDLKQVEFVNGLYIKDGIIQAVIEGYSDYIEPITNVNLPLGFTYDFDYIEDNEGNIIEVIVWSIDNKKIKTITNTKDIRKKLYERVIFNENGDSKTVEGFTLIDEKGKSREMVRFKRSSGSSRIGKCLFIDKKLYSDMMVWSMMGLKYNESDETDLAAIEAYISLTTSSIIDTIKIDPKSILLIEDAKSVFKDNVIVTKIEKINGVNKLVTEEEDEFEITNKIWDGQSLIDSSVVGSRPNDKIHWVDGRYSDKGFLLLRNRFVKSACFQCDIQKFFKDNNITSKDQLNGYTLATDIKDIKLITTPSSIKYLKFGEFKDFIKECSSVWGIVKYEKPTHYFNGRFAQTHYQLLNTIQMSYEDTEKFLQPSLDYIRLLKQDVRVLREHLKLKINKPLDDEDVIDNRDEFIFNMLSITEDFCRTDMFVNFREEIIKNYIKNLKRGHVLVNGSYAVLCGNGYEMLRATIRDKKHKNYLDIDDNNVLKVDKGVLDKNEIHCCNFDYKDLFACRSPHITMANLWLCKNVKCNEIDKYFYKSKNIVHLSSIKNNILERANSCDFDSDSFLICDEQLLRDNIEKNYDKFKVPTSGVDIKLKTREFNNEQKAILDYNTSENLIGYIINTSQHLNSKLWNMVNNGYEIESKEVQELYKVIAKLGVMSCLEIDKAKKEVPINMSKELSDIINKYVCVVIDKNNKVVEDKEILDLWEEMELLKADEQDITDYKEKLEGYNKIKIKPQFFEYIKKKDWGEDKSIYSPYKTTMDYLEKIIKDKMKNIKARKRQGEYSRLSIYNLFSRGKTIDSKKCNSHQIEKYKDDCYNLKTKLDAIWSNNIKPGDEKWNEANEVKNAFIEDVKKLKVNSSTIKKLIVDIDNELNKKALYEKEVQKNKNRQKDYDEKLVTNARNIVVTMYKAHTKVFMELFEEKKEHHEIIRNIEYVPEYVLDRIENKEIINIYDMQYIVLGKNDEKIPNKNKESQYYQGLKVCS